MSKTWHIKSEHCLRGPLVEGASRECRGMFPKYTFNRRTLKVGALRQDGALYRTLQSKTILSKVLLSSFDHIKLGSRVQMRRTFCLNTSSSSPQVRAVRVRRLQRVREPLRFPSGVRRRLYMGYGVCTRINVEFIPIKQPFAICFRLPSRFLHSAIEHCETFRADFILLVIT